MVTFDQPRFALAKQIQCKWPEDDGKDKVVVMFGGFHIEMAALKTLGDWLDGSGWMQVLVQAEITAPNPQNDYSSCAQPMSPTQHELTKSLWLHYLSCSTLPMTATVREKLQRQMIISSLKTGATTEEKTSLSSSTGQLCWN